MHQEISHEQKSAEMPMLTMTQKTSVTRCLPPMLRCTVEGVGVIINKKAEQKIRSAMPPFPFVIFIITDPIITILITEAALITMNISPIRCPNVAYRSLLLDIPSPVMPCMFAIGLVLVTSRDNKPHF